MKEKIKQTEIIAECCSHLVGACASLFRFDLICQIRLGFHPANLLALTVKLHKIFVVAVVVVVALNHRNLNSFMISNVSYRWCSKKYCMSKVHGRVHVSVIYSNRDVRYAVKRYTSVSLWQIIFQSEQQNTHWRQKTNPRTKPILSLLSAAFFLKYFFFFMFVIYFLPIAAVACLYCLYKWS